MHTTGEVWSYQPRYNEPAIAFKDPTSVRAGVWDLTDWLAQAQATLLTASSEVESGDVVIDNTAINGNEIRFTVSGGTSGTSSFLIFRANTDKGDVGARVGYLQVDVR